MDLFLQNHSWCRSRAAAHEAPEDQVLQCFGHMLVQTSPCRCVASGAGFTVSKDASPSLSKGRQFRNTHVSSSLHVSSLGPFYS